MSSIERSLKPLDQTPRGKLLFQMQLSGGASGGKSYAEEGGVAQLLNHHVSILPHQNMAIPHFPVQLRGFVQGLDDRRAELRQTDAQFQAASSASSLLISNVGTCARDKEPEVGDLAAVAGGL
jgi:hypothetical protein